MKKTISVLLSVLLVFGIFSLQHNYTAFAKSKADNNEIITTATFSQEQVKEETKPQITEDTNTGKETEQTK